MEHRGQINTGQSPNWDHAVVQVDEQRIRVTINQFDIFVADRSAAQVNFETGADGVVGISTSDEVIWFLPNNLEAFRVDVLGATSAADRMVLARANTQQKPSQDVSAGAKKVKDEWLVFGGAGVAALAAFMPWATGTSFFGQRVSVSGFSEDVLYIGVYIGVTAILYGFTLLLIGWRIRATGLRSVVGKVLGSLVASFAVLQPFMWWAFLTGLIQDHGAAGVVSPGSGFYLASLGVVVAAVGLFRSLLNNPRQG